MMLEKVHDTVEQSLLKEVAILRESQDKFRMMLEKVHDTVEQSLLKEVAILRESQDKFRMMLEKVHDTVEQSLLKEVAILRESQDKFRMMLEKVHDTVEQSLLKEVAILRESQDKFRMMLEKVSARVAGAGARHGGTVAAEGGDHPAREPGQVPHDARKSVSQVRAQSKNCRATQHELETDLRNKEYALGIDSMCHQLNNFSKGLQFYAGIERYDPTVCDGQRWAAASAATLQRSQSERAKAVQLLSDTDNLINIAATQIWDQWSNIQMTLYLVFQIQQEIFDIEKTLELLNKAIEDKLQPMKVAHTRLQARTNRPHLEKCRDEAQNRYLHTIFYIEKMLELHQAIEDKLQPMKEAHTRLQARTNRPHLEKCRDEAQNRYLHTIFDIEKTLELHKAIEDKLQPMKEAHTYLHTIFDIEKTLELHKAIEDKLQPMKVAHTRLQARTNQPHLEKCRDEAQNRLVKEVCDLQETMETLRSKIATAEGTHQTLLGVRAGLEADLRNKSTTLFIDRDQCMGLRRGYPVTAAIKA
ncbi:Tektin-3, partial [Operophtera brumata]